MLLFLLVLLLFLTLLANYRASEHVLVAPSVIFAGSFCLSSFWALMYAGKWNLDLHMNTFLVILLGTLEFSLIAYVFHVFYPKRSLPDFEENVEVNSVNINTWKIIVIVLFEIAVMVLTLKAVRNIVPDGSISQAIYAYRSQVIDPVKSLSLKSLPRIVVLSRAFTDAIGYFFAYLSVKDLILMKKFNIKYIFPFIFAMANGLMLGSRGSTMMLLLSALIYSYCLFMKKNKWNGSRNSRIMLIAFAIFVVIAVSFQSLASLLGRNVSQFSGGDYLAIYLGAEIKNLDTFLQSNIMPVQHGIIGGQTFINLNSTFSKVFGLRDSKYSLNLPFLTVNGYSLGNVYTAFYSYIVDFGYVGVPILVGIMSIISQFSFEKMRRFSVEGSVPLSVLIYGRIATALVFVFFSNKFYEDIFTLTFIRMIVFWVILNWFLFGSKGNPFKLIHKLRLEHN
ncbi:oligosaccharide repeat unit polymerase [Lactiplantibacillus plantarum]|uniref:O-antigen polymerase n=1 Tax=Lactiplantibacillus plantarum TaxID=1590 RepID=UPI00385353BD|nr:oligosaccharide repeat unit polymerase [Lactiplantibacillus plantarum]